jgi:protein SCO1/2
MTAQHSASAQSPEPLQSSGSAKSSEPPESPESSKSPEPPKSSEPPEPPAGGGLSPRLMLALLVIVVIAGGVALLTTSGAPHRVKAPGYDGSAVTPPQPPPPLSLRNYNGERVNIDRYRGRAVLVTFLYTHCPDVCPLIASNMRAAQEMMGSAEAARAQVIAVSVDPRGDTPSTVAAFLARHGMTGRMKYLIGSPRELAPVWKAWNVGSARDIEQPQFIDHTALVYGIDASGKLTTVYEASFAPKEIAHDVPLLASS